MKNAIVMILAGVIATPVTAQPATTGLTVQGNGAWEMICHVTRGSDVQTQLLDFRNPSLSGFSRVSCDQTGGSRGPLVVSVAGPAACPFKVASGAACRQTFTSGRSGSFAIRAKRP